MPKSAHLCAVNTANIELKHISKIYWWYSINQTIKYALDLLPFRFLFLFGRYELVVSNKMRILLLIGKIWRKLI